MMERDQMFHDGKRSNVGKRPIFHVGKRPIFHDGKRPIFHDGK